MLGIIVAGCLLLSVIHAILLKKKLLSGRLSTIKIIFVFLWKWFTPGSIVIFFFITTKKKHWCFVCVSANRAWKPFNSYFTIYNLFYSNNNVIFKHNIIHVRGGRTTKIIDFNLRLYVILICSASHVLPGSSVILSESNTALLVLTTTAYRNSHLRCIPNIVPAVFWKIVISIRQIYYRVGGRAHVWYTVSMVDHDGIVSARYNICSKVVVYIQSYPGRTGLGGTIGNRDSFSAVQTYWYLRLVQPTRRLANKTTSTPGWLTVCVRTLRLRHPAGLVRQSPWAPHRSIAVLM